MKTDPTEAYGAVVIVVEGGGVGIGKSGSVSDWR